LGVKDTEPSWVQVIRILLFCVLYKYMAVVRQFVKSTKI
jgi:hypothetical protein